MPAPVASIGIDLGGSWIRIAGVDATGFARRWLKRAAPPRHRLNDFLLTTFRRWSIDRVPVLVIASRGVWSPLERRDMVRQLSPLARRTTAVSDVEGAWFAAFHDRPEGGIVTVAGTGSIALGRDADGCFEREGGLGPLLGDEGSAFWIGRAWLKRTGAQPATRRVLAALRRSESPVAHVAKVARTVLRAAEQGNRCAREILTEAHREVALVTLGLIRRLHFRETIPLSYGGALLDEEDFRAGWWKTLRSLAGSSSRRLALVPPGTDAATAAALWGLKS